MNTPSDGMDPGDTSRNTVLTILVGTASLSTLSAAPPVAPEPPRSAPPKAPEVSAEFSSRIRPALPRFRWSTLAEHPQDVAAMRIGDLRESLAFPSARG